MVLTCLYFWDILKVKIVNNTKSKTKYHLFFKYALLLNVL